MWPEGAMWSDERVGEILAERDAAREELDDKTVALGEAEAWLTRYAHERDAATARAERAEAAIGRVRGLLHAWSVEIGWQQAQYGDGSDKVAVGRLVGRQDAYRDLLAALDSTDPVEAAPEEQRPAEGGSPTLLPAITNSGSSALTRPARSGSGLPVDGEERK